MRLTIYVPRPGSQVAAHLVPGSAVVGDPARAVEGILTCWYEGNVGNRASNLRDYYSKLCCAAGRLATSYPTSAAEGFRLADLVPVGTFDADRDVVIGITDEAALRAWSGEGAEQVTGKRLPPGPASWPEAAKVSQPPHSRAIGRQDPDSPAGMWFRSQAGQLVRFAPDRKGAEVFEHDDPRLPAMLAPLSLDHVSHRLVFGESGG